MSHRQAHPAQTRFFPGQRTLNLLLRAAHLVGIAGIGAGFLFGLERTAWDHYWLLTLFTGIGLTALYLWSSISWLLELKGFAVLLKVALLGLALVLPEHRAGLFITIIVISALSAHAPARIRAYRWIGGQRS
ncbi:MAG: hypothetical protein KDJ33_10540 [Gammaproteobacteria bacterium]|nr:hypothetical protein [Gammaproteobacteria bacterium]